jgi:hypothetical protein
VPERDDNLFAVAVFKKNGIRNVPYREGRTVAGSIFSHYFSCCKCKLLLYVLLLYTHKEYMMEFDSNDDFLLEFCIKDWNQLMHRLAIASRIKKADQLSKQRFK